MALFLVAMVGLVTAHDLLLLFVFFDLTAVASYFLIGFDHQQREARLSALMALLVTGVCAVLLLIGILVLRRRVRHLLDARAARPVAAGPADPTVTLAGALIAVAALAKSAQVPLHFWLPRAMAAPTPVSAYLHSAAMVAAGVFVLGRVHPLLASRALSCSTGCSSSGWSRSSSAACSRSPRTTSSRSWPTRRSRSTATWSPCYGVGGAAGAAAACFYVLAHAIAKSALFMTSGAVTEATGGKALSAVGGLASAMPALAVASGLAAASLAALPLTIGFFKDELFFTAAPAGPVAPDRGGRRGALTVAYIGRFWPGCSWPARRTARAIPDCWSSRSSCWAPRGRRRHRRRAIRGTG